MRVLLLTQWFEPEPILKGLALARGLAAQGHEVRVITGFPNYPGGALYPGYRIRLVQHEVIDGIPVTRVPLYASHSHSKIGRVLNYVTFSAAALVGGLCTRFKPDVMYVYHPPTTTAFAGALIGLLRRVPFVLDVQDLWPDTLPATGMLNNPVLLKIIGRAMRWTYRRATLVLPQSQGFVDRLTACGVDADKIRVIPNWCNEEALLGRPAQGWVPPAALAGKFVIGFAGNIGMAQGLDAVLDAAAILQNERPDIGLFFVGDGTALAALKSRALDLALTNVIFIPAMPMREVGALLERADALLVHLRPDPLFDITVPGKTQAYMFAAKPIVMAVAGDAANLVKRAECGLPAEPGNAVSIAGAIRAMADIPVAERLAMGQRGHAYYIRELSFQTGIRAISEALGSAVERWNHAHRGSAL